ncbi:MFS transporter [Francisella adeliensis]|uniref:MFS transporter n=1 Tax=Francisella adeliensis TaxID=2007306 RepID=A0A2Z4XYB1_9GAMM|nr:MFS transporter [Francisella adeliensis]AXA33656.1 MFS transporter [Francisella adeliensis]MBK2085547.1 MFS transporter [Francisella adeliensis]MBK2097425.1 MFS transporter [Francisella adeliensis]QIW11890.1 MFS transporter [Francisella adeliensis]QIW13766.1 MFS transporter [Francisella adeliensis]
MLDKIYKKVSWKIIPFLLICYTVAYLDRVNVSFAKIQMMSDLSLSETVYGFGAGIFFVGYFLFEVPSNYVLVKIGPSRWLGFLMVVWGALSSCTMFVETANQYYVLRFILGAAEAGFFPGVIYYLSQWYPSYRRAKVTAIFFSATAFSGIFGGPISGFIMDIFNQYNYDGWRMLFLMEGIPSILLGLITPIFLPTISKAKWLNQDEKVSLQYQLDEEKNTESNSSKLSVFLDPRVWWLSLIYFCGISGLYAISFYLPTLIQASGVTNIFTIGVISSIPYLFAVIVMIGIGASSDHFKERKYHLIGISILAVVGFIGTGIFDGNTYLTIITMSLATAGILALIPLFWSLPAALMSGMAAAIAIAIINSVGNLSGFITPYLVGYIIDSTSSISLALYIVALIVFIGAILIHIFFKHFVRTQANHD